MSVITGRKFPANDKSNPGSDTASVERLDSEGNCGLSVVSYTGALKVRVAISGLATYVGEAVPGTAENAPRWRVQRVLSVPGGKNIDWAGRAGAHTVYGSFDHKWSERETLTYG
jgi:hypothetical protein